MINGVIDSDEKVVQFFWTTYPIQDWRKKPYPI